MHVRNCWAVLHQCIRTMRVRKPLKSCPLLTYSPSDRSRSHALLLPPHWSISAPWQLTSRLEVGGHCIRPSTQSVDADEAGRPLIHLQAAQAGTQLQRCGGGAPWPQAAAGQAGLIPGARGFFYKRSGIKIMWQAAALQQPQHCISALACGLWLTTTYCASRWLRMKDATRPALTCTGVQQGKVGRASQLMLWLTPGPHARMRSPFHEGGKRRQARTCVQAPLLTGRQRLASCNDETLAALSPPHTVSRAQSISSKK